LDSAVGAIMTGVEQRGLAGKVNLIVVSDHGMAEVQPEHFIYLDDLIDTATVTVAEVGAIVGLSPRHGTGDDVFRRLSSVPHLKVYRKRDIPAAYHYRDNPRIPPIIGVADEGWALTSRGYVAARGGHLLKGMHGYPPDVPAMHAIFLARGPAFRRGAVVAPFQNIHIYNLLARILGLRPAPNDGTPDSVRSLLAGDQLKDSGLTTDH
jgi:predicted AlkP superfamily pyrophosphatase or phosphodiesterase